MLGSDVPNIYIPIYCVCTIENEKYIDINTVARAKGLKSNRSIRLEINKPCSKYIAREISVNGGKSYEILYSTLEPEIQAVITRTTCDIIITT